MSFTDPASGGTRRNLRLSDGRRMDYREFGDPTGEPAIHLHGTPSSASEAGWLDKPARALGLRVVSPDRPGYLGSDPHPAPSLEAVAEDVVELANALGFARFGVVGFSGGGAYALATARLAGNRVTVAHLCAAMGSLADARAYRLARGRRLLFAAVVRAPRISLPILSWTLGRVGRTLQARMTSPSDAAHDLFEGAARGAQVEAVAAYIRSTDATALHREVADYVAGTLHPEAVLADMTAIMRPWPFDVSDVQVPIELWHGRADPAVPVGYATGLAAVLPNATAHIFDGEGHFVIHTHGMAIASSLRGHASGNR